MTNSINDSANMENLGLVQIFPISGLLTAGDYLSKSAVNSPKFRKQNTRLYPLKNQTVIYGKNGSGKSSFLRMFQNAVRGEVSPFEGLVVQYRDDFRQILETVLSLAGPLCSGDVVELVEEYPFNPSAKQREQGFMSLDWSSHRQESFDYELSELFPYLLEWAKQGLFVITKPLDPNRHGLEMVPIVKASLDDCPLIMNAMNSIRGKMASDFKPIGTFSHAELPLLNGRNFPEFTYQGVRQPWQSIPTNEEVVFLDVLPIAQISRLMISEGKKIFGGEELETFLQIVACLQKFDAQSLLIHMDENRSIVASLADDSQNLVNDGKLKLRELFISLYGPKSDGTSLELNHVTKDLLIRLFPDWYSLAIDWGDELTRMSDECPNWQINGQISLENASNAEQRWLNLVTDVLRVQPSFLVIDEPERGLHRQAEWQAARAISELSNGGAMLVATHSPSILEIENAFVVHMVDGELRPLSTKSEDLLSAGLRPHDLLGTYRGFLVVEGLHDKLVIEHLLGDVLEERRIRIVQSSGAAKYEGLISSGLLFDFSTAPVVISVDNIENHKVRKAWDAVRQTFELDKSKSAKQRLRTALSSADEFLPINGSPGEYVFIRRAMEQALQSGQASRVTFFGFSKADIEFYLPPESFGLKRSWESLHNEWKASPANQNRKAFKDSILLTDDRGNRLVNLNSIRSALDALQDSGIPDDFQELVRLLNNL